MKTMVGMVAAFVLSIAFCDRLNADPVTYDLTYQSYDVGGVSFATGQVTIEESALTPNNFLFTIPTSFIDSFSLTFFDYPNYGPITFGLSDLGAAFLQTDGSGSLYDFNVWSFDRLAVGTNDCQSCTGPYLDGFAYRAAQLRDPVRQTAVGYDIQFTEVPEPSSAWLLVACGIIGLVKKKTVR